MRQQTLRVDRAVNFKYYFSLVRRYGNEAALSCNTAEL